MPILSSLGAASSKDYGFRNVVTLKLAIAANQTDLNLRTYALANGWTTGLFLQVTVNSGIYILASSTATPALTVSGAFPQGVRLINEGYIIGYGGKGGAGSINSNGGAGLAGGSGITASANLFVVNNGTVGGGGGGGGGGAGSNYGDLYGGGGGGGGATYGAGGAGGSGTGPGTGTGGPGGAATLSTGGTAGASNYAKGGVGGGWGTAGGSGTNANGGSGGAGGAAGNYLTGSSYVVWEVTGTRLGNVS